MFERFIRFPRLVARFHLSVLIPNSLIPASLGFALALGPALSLMPASAAAQSNQGFLSKLFGGLAKPRPSRTRVYMVPRGYRGGNSGYRPYWSRRRGQGGDYTYVPFATYGGSGSGVAIRRAPRSRGYRTMCVRLCDGYYWPISFATSRGRFSRDRSKCESSCQAGTRLFIMPSSGDNIASMRDLAGHRYAKLENAFRYRKKLVNACTCRAEPWSSAARWRHRRYAALARQKDGGDIAEGTESAEKTAGNGAQAVPPGSMTQAPASALPAGRRTIEPAGLANVNWRLRRYPPTRPGVTLTSYRGPRPPAELPRGPAVAIVPLSGGSAAKTRARRSDGLTWNGRHDYDVR